MKRTIAKYCILLCLAVASPVVANAQKLYVLSPIEKIGVMTEDECPDNKDKKSYAKLIVDIPLGDVEVKCKDMIGKAHKKNGQYELYIKTEVKKTPTITVKHKKYDKLEVEAFYNGKNLEEKNVYQLKLSRIPEKSDFEHLGDLTIKASGSKNRLIGKGGKSGDVEIYSNEGAAVYIDGVFVGLSPVFISGKNGAEFHYMLQKDLYHNSSGFAKFDKNRQTIEEKLRPAYGTLKVTSQPENAFVYIDDRKVGATPYTASMLASGEHKVKVSTDDNMWKTDYKTIEIRDEQVTEQSFTLLPLFANVKLVTLPDADIYVDGKWVATGECTYRFKTGKYKVTTSYKWGNGHGVEAKDGGYAEGITAINVNSGTPQTFKLNPPTPMYTSVTFVSTPPGADVFIDGEKKGKTPIRVDSVLVGERPYLLLKEDFGFKFEKITVEQGRSIIVEEEIYPYNPNNGSISDQVNNEKIHWWSRKGRTVDAYTSEEEEEILPLEIESQLKHVGSVSSSECPNDRYGNPCAKIIVEVPLDDIEIEGGYILPNSVKHTTGQYEFFVSVPSNPGATINVSHKYFPSVDIPLWIDDAPLVKREAYNVKIALPEMTEREEYLFVKDLELTHIIKSIKDEYESSKRISGKFIQDRGMKFTKEGLWENDYDYYYHSDDKDCWPFRNVNSRQLKTVVCADGNPLYPSETDDETWEISVFDNNLATIYVACYESLEDTLDQYLCRNYILLDAQEFYPLRIKEYEYGQVKILCVLFHPRYQSWSIYISNKENIEQIKTNLIQSIKKSYE